MYCCRWAGDSYQEGWWDKGLGFCLALELGFCLYYSEKKIFSVNGPSYCLWDYNPCGGEEANPSWNHLASLRDLQLGNGILSLFLIYCFKTTGYGAAATKLKTATESFEVGV